jgi:hypothetical protein
MSAEIKFNWDFIKKFGFKNNTKTIWSLLLLNLAPIGFLSLQLLGQDAGFYNNYNKLTSRGLFVLIFSCLCSIVYSIYAEIINKKKSIETMNEVTRLKDEIKRLKSLECHGNPTICTSNVVYSHNNVDKELTEKVFQLLYSKVPTNLKRLVFNRDRSINTILKDIDASFKKSFPNIIGDMISISVYYHHDGMNEREWKYLDKLHVDGPNPNHLLRDETSTLSNVIKCFDEYANTKDKNGKKKFTSFTIMGSKQSLWEKNMFSAKFKEHETLKKKNDEGEDVLTGSIICMPFFYRSTNSKVDYDVKCVISLSTHSEDLFDDNDTDLRNRVLEFLKLFRPLLLKEAAYKYLEYRVNNYKPAREAIN